MISDRFECMDCYYIGPLNAHGGCDRCLSRAVVSEHTISEEGCNSSQSTGLTALQTLLAEGICP